jgi:hypothetical protein
MPRPQCETPLVYLCGHHRAKIHKKSKYLLCEISRMWWSLPPAHPSPPQPPLGPKKHVSHIVCPSPTISHAITQSSIKNLKLICKVPQTAGTGPRFFFPQLPPPQPPKLGTKIKSQDENSTHEKEQTKLGSSSSKLVLLTWVSTPDLESPELFFSFTAGSYFSSNQV